MLVVAYGRELVKNTYDALAASDIAEHLKPGMTVSVKPNLVVARPACEGATTHPEIVEGVIHFLKDFGISKIKVIESSWVGENTKRAFKVCGYEELSRKYGVPLVDIKTDTHTALKHGDTKIEICGAALNTDFLINVPVLKAHCQTRLTCCMKNLKGCIPDSEKRRFHALGIHKPVAVLNLLLKTGYCVVDGICDDLSFEEGGNPVEANRIIIGQNPLTVDSYCAELIGYRPDEIEYLSIGKELGLGEYISDKTKIIELNPDEKTIHTTGNSHQADRYRDVITEDSACSSCYAALVYALYRLGKARVAEKIHIGQGFKGKRGDGIGIGNCARGFSRCVPGCPPKATDMIALLKSL